MKQEKEELKLEEEKPVVEEVPAKRKRKQLVHLSLSTYVFCPLPCTCSQTCCFISLSMAMCIVGS